MAASPTSGVYYLDPQDPHGKTELTPSSCPQTHPSVCWFTVLGLQLTTYRSEILLIIQGAVLAGSKFSWQIPVQHAGSLLRPERHMELRPGILGLPKVAAVDTAA